MCCHNECDTDPRTDFAFLAIQVVVEAYWTNVVEEGGRGLEENDQQKTLIFLKGDGWGVGAITVGLIDDSIESFGSVEDVPIDIFKTNKTPFYTSS